MCCDISDAICEYNSQFPRKSHFPLITTNYMQAFMQAFDAILQLSDGCGAETLWVLGGGMLNLWVQGRCGPEIYGCGSGVDTFS